MLVKVLWIYLLALRGQCVWDPNTVELWAMKSKVKARGSMQCVLHVSVYVYWSRDETRQGGRSARIISRLMEGVHEEFRLALRESK